MCPYLSVPLHVWGNQLFLPLRCIRESVCLCLPCLFLSSSSQCCWFDRYNFRSEPINLCMRKVHRRWSVLPVFLLSSSSIRTVFRALARFLSLSLSLSVSSLSRNLPFDAGTHSPSTIDLLSTKNSLWFFLLIFHLRSFPSHFLRWHVRCAFFIIHNIHIACIEWQYLHFEYIYVSHVSVSVSAPFHFSDFIYVPCRHAWNTYPSLLLLLLLHPKCQRRRTGKKTPKTKNFLFDRKRK